MTDTPDTPTPGESPHAWVHEHLAAYLAGGLSAEERQRFDTHVNACVECFDAFTEARDADRALLRAFGPLVPAAELEEKVVTHFRENTMKRLVHPMLRRAGYAAAACVALAATGVFANYVLHADGKFSNPFAQKLVAEADAAAPELNGRIEKFAQEAKWWDRDKQLPASLPSSVAARANGGAVNLKGQALVFSTPQTRGEAKNAIIPVIKGSDPNTIPVSEDLRTQIIPLNNLSAPALVGELRSFVSADADIVTSSGSNSIVITDTSAKIHRVAEIVKSLDGPDKANGVVQYRQLANANAADAAKYINSLSSSKIGVPAGAAGGSGGSSATGGRMHADADAKTNTLILSGPPDEVQKALETASEMDTKGGLANADRAYDAIVHRTGTEDMRQSVDSNEHGIPNSTDSAAANWGGLPPRDDRNSALAFNDSGKKPLDAQHGNGADSGFEFGNNQMSLAQNEQNGRQGGQQAGGQQPGAQNIYGWAEGGYTYNRRQGTADSTSDITALGWDYKDVGGIINKGGDMRGISGGALAYGDGHTEMPPSDALGKKDNMYTSAGADGIISTTGYTPANGNLPASGQSITKAGNGSLALNGGGALALADGQGGKFTLGAGISTNSGQTGQMSSTKTRVVRGAPANGQIVTIAGNLAGESGGGAVIFGGGTVALDAGTLNGGELNDAKKLPSDTNKVAVSNGGAADNRVYYGTFQNDASGKTAEELEGKDKGDVDAQKLAYGVQAGTDFSPATGDDAGRNALLLAAATPSAPGTPAAPAQAPSTQPQPPKPAPDVAAGLKIIRNGTIEFEVSNFNDAYRAVSRIAGAEHGFVASTSSDKLANGKVRGTIVVRVPPENLEEFLTSLRALGDLKSQQIAASDVTKDYYDIASELRGLTTMETRLLDLIKNGKGEVKDLIEAEKQLGETRIKIERLKGQISYYDNLVSLCTISIVAYEKDIQTPTAASEQEIVGLNVETEQVESKYQAARKIFEDAKGRIVESQLKNTDADHVAAHIIAEVPPDQADFVAGQLKQLGKVASFNRDRKQTTTGGAGGPGPAVQVEHKDTRITIDLFNLANMQPRETTVLRVAVANVESAYTDILARVGKDAGNGAAPPASAPAATPASDSAAPRAVGHVIASALNGQGDQMSAEVRAEIRADSAPDVIAAIRNYGEVEYSSLANNPDNASTTSAKRGIQLSLVNIASIPPRQINSVNVAVRDVDEAYNDLLKAIRRQAPAAQPGTVVGSQLMPATVGRVLSSGMNGQRPEDKSGDIRAEIRADQADDILNMAEKSGELLTSSTTDIPESTVATAIRRGLVVHFVNVAGVAPREAQQIRAVALDVPKAYQTLLNALQNLAGKAATGPGGSVHIFTSSLTGNDRRTMKAHFTFDAPARAESEVAKAFADAGIDFLSRNIVKSSDTANTLDSKIRYQIDEISAAESLEPRRTFLLTEEVPDVDKAVNDLRASFPGLDFNVSHPQDGNASAHAIADVSVEESRNLRMAIANLHAVEKDNQVLNNNNVPETKFGRERVDVTFRGEAPILKKDQGVSSAFRAAMSTISAALFTAIYLIIVGLVFALPFALVLWPVWRMIRRKRATVRA